MTSLLYQGDELVSYKHVKSIIVTFYAASDRGSEYRSGFEFIRFAAAHHFDLAIVADLDQNSDLVLARADGSKLPVLRIPSIIKQQKLLYKYSDFLVQYIWHHRVWRWMKRNGIMADVIWIQNGAQPWQPFHGYYNSTRRLIWGPVGGGAAPPTSMKAVLPVRVRLREHLRSYIERRFLRSKRKFTEKRRDISLAIIARTFEAKLILEEGLGVQNIPVIPEILAPIRQRQVRKKPMEVPEFLWVGQNVPRKNLRLAIDLYARLRTEHFPLSKLHIFGCDGYEGCADSVIFHGWVPAIDWQAWNDAGVLLLTSYREGLPSVILEAVSAGLFCISSDTGSIGLMKQKQLFKLPMEDYPFYSDNIISEIARLVKIHLDSEEIFVDGLSFDMELQNFLGFEETK